MAVSARSREHCTRRDVEPNPELQLNLVRPSDILKLMNGGYS